METLQWLYPENRIQYTYDMENYCRTASGHRIVRKEDRKGIHYQLFLTDRTSWEMIKTALNGIGSFISYGDSSVHFYGGNYIYINGRDAFKAVKELLGVEIKW